MKTKHLWVITAIALAFLIGWLVSRHSHSTAGKGGVTASSEVHSKTTNAVTRETPENVAKKFVLALVTFEDVHPYVSPALYQQIGKRIVPEKEKIPTVTEIKARDQKEYAGYITWQVAVSVDDHDASTPGVDEHVYQVFVDPALNKVAKYEVLY